DIRKEMQQTMDSHASVYRTEDTLKQALTDVQTLKERYQRITVSDKGKRYNTDLLEAVELGFLLELAEVLVVGALARKESRGGHARDSLDRKSTRLNSSHVESSYAVFCLKKKRQAPAHCTGPTGRRDLALHIGQVCT